MCWSDPLTTETRRTGRGEAVGDDLCHQSLSVIPVMPTLVQDRVTLYRGHAAMAKSGQSASGLSTSTGSSWVCSHLEANPTLLTEVSRTGRVSLRSFGQTEVWRALAEGVAPGQGALRPLAIAGAFAGQGLKLSLNSGRVQGPVRQGGRL